MEDKKVGLFLDVKSVALEQDVVVGFFTHLFDEGESQVKIVVFVDRFEESTEDVRATCLGDLDGNRKSDIFKSRLADLVFRVWLASRKQERNNHEP